MILLINKFICNFSKRFHNHQILHTASLSLTAANKCKDNDKKNIEIKYTVKQIKLRTCGTVYEKYSHLKIYKNSPRDGIVIDAEYADTAPDNTSLPVIVALHGMGGTMTEYTKLLNYFLSKGNCRVIVPNFPDFSVTERTLGFWHSSLEYAQFIRDLLAQINIKKVDTLVCFSAGVYPGSYLWSQSHDDFSVKSVALLNTPNIDWIPPKQIVYYHGFWRYFNTEWGRNRTVKSKTLGFWVRSLKPHIGSDRNSLLKSKFRFIYSDVDTLSVRLRYLRQNFIPSLVLISEKDTLLKYRTFKITAKEMGIKENETTVFDSVGDEIKMISNDNSNGLMHLINIRPAGHYGFVKYADIVNPYIEKLVLRVKH